MADIRDVGRYVAKIIADPRTLNKKVHVFNEVYTRNQVYNLLESVSGEKLDRQYVSLHTPNTTISAEGKILNLNRS